jgi:hypothetical protein
LSKESSVAVWLDVSADQGRELLDELEDQDLRVVCFRPGSFVGLCRPVTSRGLSGSFPFHLRTALLRPGRKYALSERDGRTGQDNFAPPAPPIHIGTDFPASRAFVGGFDAKWGAQDLENRLNHPTPAIQFGIVLQGIFSITTTDGETRRLIPGSVFRLEDTSPCKGHITVVGDQPGFLMFVR